MIPIVILAIENDSDREFMASLYIKYYPIMRKSVYNILQKHNDDVDDIIHDACEKLIDKI